MKKLFTILTILVVITLMTSCQKDLPDSMQRVVVGKGISTQPPDPIDSTQQGTIPVKEDNPMPEY